MLLLVLEFRVKLSESGTNLIVVDPSVSRYRQVLVNSSPVATRYITAFACTKCQLQEVLGSVE